MQEGVVPMSTLSTSVLTAVNDHLQGSLKAEVPFPNQILAPVIFMLSLGCHALYQAKHVNG